MSAPKGLPRTPELLVTLSVAAFLGKSLGGVIADRLGWVKTAVGALLLSCPLLFYGAVHPLLLALGLFVFQMTMPITLVALSRAMPSRPATAFGWSCLALQLGSLPSVFSWGAALEGPLMLVPLILLSLVALYLGLYGVGIRIKNDEPLISRRGLVEYSPP
jgi:FSR family fosmidomycin resistance protein-like MFS transporter